MNTEKLAETFVDLADSLVDDFDALDLLNVLVERCVDLLGVAAAGLMFADGQDQLRLAVSSSESARLMDLYQLQNDEGPCLECYRSGEPVSGAAAGARTAGRASLPLRPAKGSSACSRCRCGCVAA